MTECPHNRIKCPQDKCYQLVGNLTCQRRSELRTAFPHKSNPSQKAVDELNATPRSLAQLVGRLLAKDFFAKRTNPTSGEK